MTAILASTSGANGALLLLSVTSDRAAQLNGLGRLMTTGRLWVEQLKAIVVTLCLSGFASALIAISLRAAQEAQAFRSLSHQPAAAHVK